MLLISFIQDARFKTPVFTALQNLQQSEGGRNSAFISKALNIPLAGALAMSRVLWARSPT
jgi:hypothetical protein